MTNPAVGLLPQKKHLDQHLDENNPELYLAQLWYFRMDTPIQITLKIAGLNKDKPSDWVVLTQRLG